MFNEQNKTCSYFEADSLTFSALPLTLIESRVQHLCWQLRSGDILLLGGWYSGTTTERLGFNGSSSTADFDLAYNVRYFLNLQRSVINDWHFYCSDACGIELNGNFVITGGAGSMKTVAEFTETGEVTYLSDLQEGRFYHACSKFVDDNGETVSFNQR